MKKPAFNHPDYAGLIFNIQCNHPCKTNQILIMFYFSSYGVLSLCVFLTIPFAVPLSCLEQGEFHSDKIRKLL